MCFLDVCCGWRVLWHVLSIGLGVAAGQDDDRPVVTAEVEVFVAHHPGGVFAPVLVVDCALGVVDVKAEIILARVFQAAGAVVGGAEGAGADVVLRSGDRTSSRVCRFMFQSL